MVRGSDALQRSARLDGHSRITPSKLSPRTCAQVNTGGAAPLHLAASKGHAEAVQALLALGGDAAQPNSAGQTPLHLAAGQGHAQAAAALVAAGAPLDAKDAEGW